jgi:hypothetical protein
MFCVAGARAARRGAAPSLIGKDTVLMRVSAKTWAPLAAGVVAMCLAASARAVEADKMIPGDAEAIVSINVRQLLDSDLFKKYGKDEVEKSLQDEKAKKLLDALGLNPLKDIDSILVTSAGGTDKPKVLVVARGKFDVSKIKSAAEDYAKTKPEDLKISKDGDVTIYEGKGDNGQKVFAHLVSDGKTLLASTDKDYLVNAIKNPSDGPSKELKGALTKVSGKESIWAAAVITEAMKQQMASNPQTKNLAGKLESITGDINVGNDIALDLVIHTTDAMAAGDVKKMLNQVKPILTLMAQSNEDAAPIVQDLIDNLKITTEQSSVKVSLKVSQDLIEKASKQEKSGGTDKPPSKPESKDK